MDTTIKDLLEGVVTTRNNQSEDLIGPRKLGSVLLQAVTSGEAITKEEPAPRKVKPRRTQEQRDRDDLIRYLDRQATSARKFEQANGCLRRNGIDSKEFEALLEDLLVEVDQDES